MSSNVRSMAETFTVYRRLGWLNRWRLCHFLKGICEDPASLEPLFHLEKKLQSQSLPEGRICDLLVDATTWFNREDHENRFVEDRLQRHKLPELMQVVVIFLEKGNPISWRYRELILDILNTADRSACSPELGTEISSEQFRLRVAELISSLCEKWGDWHPYTSRNEPWRNWSNWYPYINREAVQMLRDLESIRGRVSDPQQFDTICQDMAQVVGVRAAAAILSMSTDFDEFVRFYERVLVQLKWWESHYENLLSHPKNSTELEQNLTFLEMLMQDAQLIKYWHYTPTKDSDWKLRTLLLQKVRKACYDQVWRRVSDHDAVRESILQDVEENIVREQLRQIWEKLYGSSYSRAASTFAPHLLWEFDAFTDYIPYEERNLDWTIDSEPTRRYWNWHHGEHIQVMRFFDTLKPRLRALFRRLTFSESEILFRLLSEYLSVEKFSKRVDIPIAWERSVETHEGYRKHVGEYSETVEVAHPTAFEGHIFTFERPALDKAIDFLDNIDAVHEAIQAYKTARQRLYSL